MVVANNSLMKRIALNSFLVFSAFMILFTILTIGTLEVTSFPILIYVVCLLFGIEEKIIIFLLIYC